MTIASIVITPPTAPLVTLVPPDEAPTYTLTAMTQGPQGNPGPSGGAASTYVHTQSSSLDVWTVAHNLGFRPTVTVTTTGGVEVAGGEVLHLSNNVLTITFDVAFTGIARCN